MLHRTIIRVELLSDRPWSDEDLYDLATIDYAMTEGDTSGIVKTISREILTGKEMADALLDQGSDPEFLGLDEDGNPATDCPWPYKG